MCFYKRFVYASAAVAFMTILVVNSNFKYKHGLLITQKLESCALHCKNVQEIIIGTNSNVFTQHVVKHFSGATCVLLVLPIIWSSSESCPRFKTEKIYLFKF